MDVSERLARFEPAALDVTSSGLDTSFADEFLKVAARMAKSQVKTQQAVALSLEDVKSALGQHADLLDDLKAQRREAEERNERLVRFILEVLDLVFGLYETTRDTPNAELRTVADMMSEALRPQMERIALSTIPALGEEPDAPYHFVLGTRPALRPEDRGRIVEVVRPGYLLDGRVLRKADVIVGS